MSSAKDKLFEKIRIQFMVETVLNIKNKDTINTE
jgi:hypothetical protein